MWQGARSKRQVGYLSFGNAILLVTCCFLLDKNQLYSTPQTPLFCKCTSQKLAYFLILFCLWRRVGSKQNLILQSYSSAISPHFILKWRGKQWPTQGSHSWSKLAPTTGTARGRYNGLVQLLCTAVPVSLNLVFSSQQKGFASLLHYKATSVHHWIGNPPPEHLDTQFIQRNPCLEQYFSLWGFLTRWVDFHRKWNIFFQIHFHLRLCGGEGIQSNLAVMCILSPCSYKGPYTYWEKSTELEMDVIPLQIARTVQRASWVEIKFGAWLKKLCFKMILPRSPRSSESTRRGELGREPRGQRREKKRNIL